MYLDGDLGLTVGQDCRIELHETGRHSSVIYSVCGKIAHREEDGFGVEFTSMEDRSFSYVQTMVLYSSDDPIATAEYFIERFAPSTASSC